MRGLTSTQLIKALVVEVIHNLWHAKLYLGLSWLENIQEEWYDDWALWKSRLVMREVDKQIAAMIQDPEIPPPIYWEEEKGETPLGGPMGFYYDFVDKPSGGSDPVQGSE